ncbi:MAG: hypothetical protein M1519_09350 [Actinobacteria bacterium]|nr:hypothetical protein [Actinomycetota bacterium]
MKTAFGDSSDIDNSDVEQLRVLLSSPLNGEVVRMLVNQIPKERWKELVPSILGLDTASTDLLLEEMWYRYPGDLFVLALASRLAGHLSRESSLRWADRLRERALDDAPLRLPDPYAYYLHQEDRLLDLVPIRAERILLVGVILEELRVALLSRQPCEVSTIELRDHELDGQGAEELGESVVYSLADVGRAVEELVGSFDTIICSFAFERVVDPWGLVKKLVQKVRYGGSLLARTSNAGNLRLLAGILKDGWRYSPEGLLSQQSIRFFDRQGLEQLMSDAGLTIERMIPLKDESLSEVTLPDGTVASIHYHGIHFDVDHERLDELTTSQWLTVARLRRPSEATGIKPYGAASAGRSPVVWDVFPFFNEMELLEARLETLYPAVDRFVIVEANLTYRGDPKPLWFDQNKEKFLPFMDKIVHVVADLSNGSGSAWQREAAQRDAALSTLRTASPEDLILSCDLDEIPDVNKLQAILDATKDGPVALGMAAYYYTLNWRAPFVWRHPKALRARDLPSSLSRLRMVDQYRWSALPMIADAGWHLTYFGGKQAVHEKLKAFAHAEVDTPAVHQQVDSMIARGVIHNGVKLVWVEDNFPEPIKSRFSCSSH